MAITADGVVVTNKMVQQKWALPMKQVNSSKTRESLMKGQGGIFM